MMRHHLAAADEMLPASTRNSQANVKLQHQKAQKATLKVGNPSEPHTMHSPTAKRTKMTRMNPAENYQPASLIEEAATVMTKQTVSRHLLPDDPDKQEKADKTNGVEEVKHEDLKVMTGNSYPQAAADSVALKMATSSNFSKANLDSQSSERGGESVAALVFIIVLAAFLGFCSLGGLTYLVIFGPTGKEESSPLACETPANAAP